MSDGWNAVGDASSVGVRGVHGPVIILTSIGQTSVRVELKHEFDNVTESHLICRTAELDRRVSGLLYTEVTHLKPGSDYVLSARVMFSPSGEWSECTRSLFVTTNNTGLWFSLFVFSTHKSILCLNFFFHQILFFSSSRVHARWS